MPVPTDITAGTISVSGTTVTGVGTSFANSDIRQGDTFVWIETGAGRQAPIVSTVNSNTSITLAEPWTGTAVPAGSRYRLRYQWDSSRVSAQSRQLIEMLDNGKLTSFSALTGGSDQLPYFNGANSLNQTALTSFARTLLDDTSATAARSTLDLPAWLAAFGFGITGSITETTNVNTIVASGAYAYSSTTVGSPTGSGTILHLVRSSAVHTQMALGTGTNDGSVWVRSDNSGTWTAWQPITPEMTSNSNGVAYRFANGLQICMYLTGWSIDVNTASGVGGRGSQSWTFPSAFLNAANVTAWSVSNAVTRWGGSASSISGSGCTLNQFGFSQSATTSTLTAVAVGLWK